MITRSLTVVGRFALALAVALVSATTAAAATFPPGFTVHEVASFPGDLPVGLAINPDTGDIFVATDNGNTSVKLWKVTPAGVKSQVGTYNIVHVFGSVELEWGPDGLIYVASLNGQVFTIHPTTGAQALFSNGVNLGSGRHGLQFDAAGKLILMLESVPNQFFRINPGAGTTFLGGYVPAAGEHGDRFSINPDGDYVVHSDGGDGRTFKLKTAGHADGTNFTREYMTSTNIFSFPGMQVQYSIGAVDPKNGDIYSSTTRGGFPGGGGLLIIQTPGNGDGTTASTAFGTNLGGVQDLDFGPRTDTGQGRALFYVENQTKKLLELRGFNSPPVASATAQDFVECGEAASLDGSESTDADGDALTFAWTTADGTTVADTAIADVVLPIGTHTLTLTVTDPDGESDSTEVTITVADTTAPSIDAVSVSPSVLWPPNHKMVPATVTVSASEHCSGGATCTITSVSSSESANASGDGNTSSDWEITGDLTLNVRSERAGGGSGRVYTVTVTCTDGAGNATTKTVTISAPHSQKK